MSESTAASSSNSDSDVQATLNPVEAAAPVAAKPTGLAITEKAVREIKRIRENDASAKDSYLRVMVVGGGCSGMSYKLGFDNQPVSASDKIFERDNERVVIDPKSYLYLNGTELDFTDGLNGTGFVFKNPNAKRTCGCGSSFSA